VGTGDGRLPDTLARREPDRLFIGLDASAAGMAALANRALRARLDNVLYVRAAVEALPPELGGTADRLLVVLPWGSLLAAVARPSVPLLRALRALGRPGARLTVVLGPDPVRDQAELRRLGLGDLDATVRGARFAADYADAGWALRGVQALDAPALSAYPSTWAAQLARGRGRHFIELAAVRL
jgi:16S rRNA (adenine(1408)-N(1))-methyltransferase